MESLEVRLFDERLLEKVAEYLSPQGAVALRAHWRTLEAEPPSVSGYHSWGQVFLCDMANSSGGPRRSCAGKRVIR